MIKVYKSIFILLIFLTGFAAFMPAEGNSSILHIDKFLHFSIFLLLTMFLDLSSKKTITKNPILVFFLIFYAGFIELVQYFLPSRSAEFLDFLSDMSGILVYLIFAPKIKVST